MAEKRKPVLIFVLRIPGKGGTPYGKPYKIELFPALAWKPGFFEELKPQHHEQLAKCRFRIRIDGRWFNDKNNRPIAYTRHEFRDLLFRSLTKTFDRILRGMDWVEPTSQND